MSKSGDDALQIIEQILPFFQPEYTITINDNVDMNQKRDVPIVLTGIDYEDNYEGDFVSRRAIIYTLSFTAKFYLYGPVTKQSIIKSVQVDQYTDLPDKSPKREQRYAVTPDQLVQILMITLDLMKLHHSLQMQKIMILSLEQINKCRRIKCQ